MVLCTPSSGSIFSLNARRFVYIEHNETSHSFVVTIDKFVSMSWPGIGFTQTQDQQDQSFLLFFREIEPIDDWYVRKRFDGNVFSGDMMNQNGRFYSIGSYIEGMGQLLLFSVFVFCVFDLYGFEARGQLLVPLSGYLTAIFSGVALHIVASPLKRASLKVQKKKLVG